jgi:hypothetical protein
MAGYSQKRTVDERGFECVLNHIRLVPLVQTRLPVSIFAGPYRERVDSAESTVVEIGIEQMELRLFSHHSRFLLTLSQDMG